MVFNGSMNHNTPDPSTPWNEIVDEAVFNLLDKDGGNAQAIHSLLSSLVEHGFINDYAKDDPFTCGALEPFDQVLEVYCPCLLLECNDSDFFFLRNVINTTTWHSAWLVYNSSMEHGPFILVYSTLVGTCNCCEHVMDLPMPRCEFVSDEDFKPFERLGEPNFIMMHDYNAVARLLARWIVEEGKEDAD